MDTPQVNCNDTFQVLRKWPVSIYQSNLISLQEYLSKKTTDIGNSVIGRTRDRRSNHVIFVSHDLQEIPESPNPNTLRYIKLKLVNDEQILKMKEVSEWIKKRL